MEEMHNTNTEIIDRDIGLFSVVSFDLMYVTVLHSYTTTGWFLNCFSCFECYAVSSEVCVDTCNMTNTNRQ